MPNDISNDLRTQLHQRLHRRMTELYAETSGATGGEYKPSRLRNLVNDVGGYDAACELIASEGGTSGFHELMALNLPRLTVEYIIVTGPWREIMPGDVVIQAMARLREARVDLPEGV